MRRSTTLFFLFALMLALCVPLTGDIQAHAQGKRSKKTKTSKKRPNTKKNKKLKVFDFTGLDVAGQLRAPQLLYFLDRANEALQRASLERRSFIPEMVRSIDEESL